ncbi:MAG TPA: Clp protease N-terminal domain-containing protein [Pseudonocardiaceae bacterium]|jgi:ATP-dependent Clp protease ATP-binding subunit ClpA|nr:Clp protease N-terminal domain-containing protein [Pseudonocardiaceae bacterium]
MLERFTTEARDVLTRAQQEAKRSVAVPNRPRTTRPTLGTEHLLLGLLAGEHGPAARVLHGHGLTTEDVRGRIAGRVDLDAEALATLGIDLDAVRRSVESSFGPGALDLSVGQTNQTRATFDVEAKRVLELSVRAAVKFGHKHIGTGHVLHGLLQLDRSAAVRTLAAMGIDVTELDAEVTALVTAEAG